ncbi:hypothetical protein [Chitinivorax sp. B]|uniref:post-PEP-CTERM-1 domain-containing protein n=1 Tax=Chitinivorax sp. B TaxID=2502235 RepID=UPI0010F4635B|nr:hypothetical protein [Chitinivorax sp. B]
MKTRLIHRAGMLLATLLAIGCAHATDTTPVADHTQVEMKVYRDPVTGQLREPEHDELANTNRVKRAVRAQPMAAPVAQPQMKRTRSGGVAMMVTEDQMNYSVAVRKADGSVDMHCVEGQEAAESLLKNAPTAQTQKEHSHER